jgi:hypothetical protein
MNSINKILMESVVDMLSHFLLKFPLIVNKEIPGLQLLHQATHVLDDVGSNSAFGFHQVLNSSNTLSWLT